MSLILIFNALCILITGVAVIAAHAPELIAALDKRDLTETYKQLAKYRRKAWPDINVRRKESQAILTSLWIIIIFLSIAVPILASYGLSLLVILSIVCICCAFKVRNNELNINNYSLTTSLF